MNNLKNDLSKHTSLDSYMEGPNIGLEKRNSKKTHSATKVFQALRIFVNKEISELIYGIIHAAKVLKKDGLLVVVTFHSLEDKIVKNYFYKSSVEVADHLPSILLVFLEEDL